MTALALDGSFDERARPVRGRSNDQRQRCRDILLQPLGFPDITTPQAMVDSMEKVLLGYE